MKKFTLRLFDALHEALIKSAAKNHRSLNSEMIHALLEYVRNQGYKVSEEKEI
jgi:predicted HicB family RNase H-like nuclease